jgi:hypothetical protein
VPERAERDEKVGKRNGRFRKVVNAINN